MLPPVLKKIVPAVSGRIPRDRNADESGWALPWAARQGDIAPRRSELHDRGGQQQETKRSARPSAGVRLPR